MSVEVTVTRLTAVVLPDNLIIAEDPLPETTADDVTPLLNPPPVPLPVEENVPSSVELYVELAKVTVVVPVVKTFVLVEK